MSINKIDLDITPEKETAVETLVQSLETEMALLATVSVEQKRRMSKMGRSNLDFVERGLQYMKNNAAYITPNISIDAHERDFKLFKWLREVEKRLELVLGKINDSAFLAESDVYKNTLLFYRTVNGVGKAGDGVAQSIARDLGAQYRRPGRNGNGAGGEETHNGNGSDDNNGNSNGNSDGENTGE